MLYFASFTKYHPASTILGHPMRTARFDSTFALLITALTAAAQPGIQWQRCLGGANADYANSIEQTSDDGYIVAGGTASSNGDVTNNQGGGDAWVVKLDALGAIEWQECLGGSGADMASKARPTADGGYVMVGHTASNDGDVSGNHGQYDLWVVKLEADGTTMWQRCLGGTGNEGALGAAMEPPPQDIVQTSDGGYLVAGLTASNNGDVGGNNGGVDAWLVKLDALGVPEWQRCLGGSAEDLARCVRQTTDGGYILAGRTSSNNGDVSGNHAPGYYDGWVVKLSGSGSVQWQRCLGGSRDEGLSAIEQTADGGYAMAGYACSNDGDVSGHFFGTISSDAWVVKLDADGALDWERCQGGSQSDYAYAIQQTTDSGYVMAGGTTSDFDGLIGFHGIRDAWVVKMDTVGFPLWQRCYGGTSLDEAYCVRQAADGGYAVAGYTGSNNADVSGLHGDYDAWVVKLGASGVGVEERSRTGFAMAPNPTADAITLRFAADQGPCGATLFDASGRAVLTRSWANTGGPFVLDLSGLAPGPYVLHSNAANGARWVAHVVKE